MDSSVCQQCSKCYEPEGGIHLLPAIKADEYHKYTFPLQYLGKSFPCFGPELMFVSPEQYKYQLKKRRPL